MYDQEIKNPSRKYTWLGAAVLVVAILLGIGRELQLAKKTSSTVVDQKCSFYFKKEKLCASLNWIKKPVNVEMPTEKDQAEFTLQFWSADKSFKSGPAVNPPGDVMVSLWMPAMGHGSEKTEIQKVEGEPGAFHVSHVLFSMGGDWEIWVSIVQGDRLVEKAKIVYRLE